MRKEAETDTAVAPEAPKPKAKPGKVRTRPAKLTPEVRRRTWVITDPVEEIDRREEFRYQWIQAGMQPGRSRDAYFLAGDKGLLGEGDDEDLPGAIRAIIAEHPDWVWQQA